jgi:hypothetical protein
MEVVSLDNDLDPSTFADKRVKGVNVVYEPKKTTLKKVVAAATARKKAEVEKSSLPR